MIRAIIVDDEALSKTVLKNLILKYCPEISLLGEASNITEAKKLIEELNPDLVFLDIEMPGGSGFELLEKLIDNPSLMVIFTTAYDQYAIKAFKFNALDYLLKPINISELIAAVAKISNPVHKKTMRSSLKHFMDSPGNSGISKNNKVALPTQEGLVFIDIANIIRCEADGKYTYCFISEGKALHSTRNLKDFEEQLTQFGFCRIHHAHLINLNHIKTYVKGNGGYVLMNNNDTVTVSKRKKEDFLKHLNKI